MLRFRIAIVCLLAVAFSFSKARCVHADEASAKAKLVAKGIRATASGVILVEEAEFSKAMTMAASLNRKLSTAQHAVRATESGDDEVDARVHQLLQENVALKRQLSQVGSNAFLYNNLAQAINTNQSELALLSSSRRQVRKETDEVRQSATAAREKYLQQIADARALADRVVEKYAALSHDKEVESALDEWNSSTGRSFELRASRGFEANLKRLAALEKKVLTGKIPLRRAAGGLFTSVIINGHPLEMMVDTGCNTMSISYESAKKMGIDVDAGEPVKVGIADGSSVNAKLVKLDSVRVGKFVAKNVNCVVASPQARDAMPLLGMSFLGHFKVQINADLGELSLLGIDSEPASAGKK